MHVEAFPCGVLLQPLCHALAGQSRPPASDKEMALAGTWSDQLGPHLSQVLDKQLAHLAGDRDQSHLAAFAQDPQASVPDVAYLQRNRLARAQSATEDRLQHDLVPLSEQRIGRNIRKELLQLFGRDHFRESAAEFRCSEQLGDIVRTDMLPDQEGEERLQGGKVFGNRAPACAPGLPGLDKKALKVVDRQGRDIKSMVLDICEEMLDDRQIDESGRLCKAPLHVQVVGELIAQFLVFRPHCCWLLLPWPNRRTAGME